MSTMCVTHREVPATAVCCICRTPICATCDFVFSYYHYCPHCAVSMGEEMSPPKRRMRTWSFILAIVATVLMAVSIVLINMADSEGAETFFGLVLFASAGASFVGAVLGMSARDKGTQGQGSVWAAIAWNGLIVVCFVFLVIVGLLVE
ncbi:MAG: B-box zinc finger protein [bacterium]